MKLLLYCCKQPHKLFNTDKGFVLSDFELGDFYKDKTLLNGKIVAECDFEVEEIKTYYNNQIYKGCRVHTIKTYNISKLLELSCLNQKQLDDYLGENNGYAIHIKNLNIFDKPRILRNYIDNDGNCINKAPQNMMYCYFNGSISREKKVLISIRPEYLVRILNKEKTIEIRKQILNWMKGENKNV